MEGRMDGWVDGGWMDGWLYMRVDDWVGRCGRVGGWKEKKNS